MSPPTHSFFFSSRRRHTRCLSDWSSDVCSSDLIFAQKSRVHCRAPITLWEQKIRSEERRVGKECRSGGSAAQLKKNGREVEADLNLCTRRGIDHAPVRAPDGVNYTDDPGESGKL